MLNRRFYIFLGISAGVHLLMLTSAINLTIPNTAAQFIEVDLMSLRRPPPDKPPEEQKKIEVPKEPAREEISDNFTHEPQPEQAVSQPEEPAQPEISSDLTSEILNPYLGLILQKLNDVKSRRKYPKEAYDREEEGEVILKVKILRDGSVAGIDVAKSSGSKSLDDDAVQLVKSAAPFPPSPMRYALSIKIPVLYNINR